MIYENVLIAFSTVYELLKRGTPGVQNKKNLINHIILDELSNIDGIQKVIARGRSVEIIPLDNHKINSTIPRSMIDEIVAKAIDEVVN